MTKKNRAEPESVTGAAIGVGRRVVTGTDAHGESTILLDGLVPDVARYRVPGATGHAVWRIPPGPASLADEMDPMESFSLEQDWYPSPGGVTASVITWEPGFQSPMHKTDTLDIVFVVSGKVELVLENGSTVFTPGECVIQRGTVHAWRVVGDEPFTGAAVILGGAHDSE